MLKSLVLILALCGDGGYKPQPIVIRIDRVVVQDYIDTVASLCLKKTVVQFRVMHLLNWYDDAGWIYEGWVLMKQDRYPHDKRYRFFQKFSRKQWEIRMYVVDYEMSERSLEDFYIFNPNRTCLKESGS